MGVASAGGWCSTGQPLLVSRPRKTAYVYDAALQPTTSQALQRSMTSAMSSPPRKTGSAGATLSSTWATSAPFTPLVCFCRLFWLAWATRALTLNSFRSRHTPWLRLARLQSVGLQTEPVSVAFATWSPPLLLRSDFACCWAPRTPKSSMQVHFWVQQEFTPPFRTPCRGPATTSRAFTNEVSSSALLSAGAISTELSAPTSTSRGRSQNTTPATVPFWLTSSFACLEAPSSCIPCCARRTREGLVASGTTCMLESRLMTSGWLVITGRTSSILYDWIYGGHTLARTALQIA